MRIKSYAFGLSRNVQANCQWLFRGKRFRFPFLGVRLAENVSNGRKSLIHPGSGKNSSGRIIRDIWLEKLLCMYMKEKALK